MSSTGMPWGLCRNRVPSPPHVSDTAGLQWRRRSSISDKSPAVGAATGPGTQLREAALLSALLILWEEKQTQRVETTCPDHSQMTRTHPSGLSGPHHSTRPPGWMPQGRCPESSQPQKKALGGQCSVKQQHNEPAGLGRQSSKCPMAAQPVCLASGLYLGVLPAWLPQWSSAMLAPAQAGSRVSGTAA